MTNLSIPNVFVSGTTAIAADVNANFDAVKTMVNTTGAPVIQDGSVSTSAKMADGIVTGSKLGIGVAGKAYMSTASPTFDSTGAVIPFDTVDSSAALAGVSISPTNFTWTAPYSGVYLVVVDLKMANTTAPCAISIVKNQTGSTYGTGTPMANTLSPTTTGTIGSFKFSIGLTAYVRLAASDTIAVQAVTSGSAQTASGGSTVNGSRFSIEYRGA